MRTIIASILNLECGCVEGTRKWIRNVERSPSDDLDVFYCFSWLEILSALS